MIEHLIRTGRGCVPRSQSERAYLLALTSLIIRRLCALLSSIRGSLQSGDGAWSYPDPFICCIRLRRQEIQRSYSIHILPSIEVIGRKSSHKGDTKSHIKKISITPRHRHIQASMSSVIQDQHKDQKPSVQVTILYIYRREPWMTL